MPRRTSILLFVSGTALGLALVATTTLLLPPPVPATPAGSSFFYTFNTPGVLQEARSMEESSSPYFWLNSGGELRMSNFTGSTMLGAAPAANRWLGLYAKNSSLDTDKGQHPQNLFRLVTRSRWENARQEALFMVVGDNLSPSGNRNASNGLLLMNRYKDADTLYYAGVRVDGTAVIKKKYNGTYYTMAQKKIFPGEYRGTQSDVNLLPHNEWLGLRTETVTNADGSVSVRLYLRRAGETQWQLLVEGKDAGQYGKTPPITGAGHAGIRTDFMDVRFESYRLKTLK